MASVAQAKLERVLNPRCTGSFSQSEVVPEPYSEVTGDSFVTFTLYAFNQLFGIPRELVTSEFEKWCRSVVARRHPYLNCSAARAIFEGRVPGIPKVTGHTRQTKVMQQALHLLDLFETLIVEYMKHGAEHGQGIETTETSTPGMLESRAGDAGNELSPGKGGDASGGTPAEKPEGTTSIPEGGTEGNGNTICNNPMDPRPAVERPGRSRRRRAR